MTLSRRSIKRFFSYTLVGGSTFAFDLALLYVLTEFASIPYTLSTPFAFLVAVSINYLLSRKFVFRGTTRSHPRGYLYFMGMSGVGALSITGAVYLLVTYAGLSYLIARILVACLVGIMNYLFNLYLNFAVAGNHA
jgi:putative flippase GtrA